MRSTKIICTLGPASSSEETIRELIAHGMNIARLNLSHGTHESHAQTIAILNKINAELERPVGILLDTKGAEIRTGDVQEPIAVQEGEEVCFAATKETCDGYTHVHVNYDGFAQDAKETDEIIVDNGHLIFDVVSIKENGSVIGRARQSGSIGSRRHINLPGADLDLPSISQKDWDDIAFAVEQEADFLALSFIREAEEVQSVRSFIEKEGAHMTIITKVETEKAVENFAEILRVSDAIMVARGDLGSEVPLEDIPVIQEQITLQCRDARKPVIVATHMLESMTQFPTPTRAEVTDVAHAVSLSADATMLSGETASGKYPVAALQTMSKIIQRAEEHYREIADKREIITDARDEEICRKIDKAIAANADEVRAETVDEAKRLSSERPPLEITVTCTLDEARELQLWWGVSTATETL